MMTKAMQKVRLFLGSSLFFVLLAGCSFDYGMASYDNGSAAEMLRTDLESCQMHCDRAYQRCGDRTAVGREGKFASGVFSAGADCQNSLRDCLSSCKGR